MQCAIHFVEKLMQIHASALCWFSSLSFLLRSITMRRPLLTVKQILAWADAHFASCKQWPNRDSGRIPGSLGETWCAIDQALTKNHRGLSTRCTLAQFLEKHRGVRNRMNLPRLNIKLILAWTDAHFERTAKWPTSASGKVHSEKHETWSAINMALSHGNRGLPGGSSLAKLLYVKRGVRSANNMPRLTEHQILRWAKAHYQRTGSWPKRNSGPVHNAPPETWGRINTAIVQGDRGLSGGSSLAQMLNNSVGVRNRKALPRLTIQQIVKWADEYFAQHRRWPTHLSGIIAGSRGETWSCVHAALSHGQRGFSGGSSLYRVLKEQRGVPRYRPRTKLVISA